MYSKEEIVKILKMIVLFLNSYRYNQAQRCTLFRQVWFGTDVELYLPKSKYFLLIALLKKTSLNVYKKEARFYHFFLTSH